MVSLIAAEDCASMADVRRGVDAIDRALVDLLAWGLGAVVPAAVFVGLVGE